MNYRKAVGGAMLLLGLISLILVFRSASHLMSTAFALGSSSSQTHSFDHLATQTMLWDGIGICCAVALFIGAGFLMAPRRKRKAAPPSD